MVKNIWGQLVLTSIACATLAACGSGESGTTGSVGSSGETITPGESSPPPSTAAPPAAPSPVEAPPGSVVAPPVASAPQPLPSAPTGTATLSWSPPTQNVSGTQLTNLAGYRIYHGTSATSLDDVREVAANSSTYQFTSLSTGTHYFAISAYNADGLESSLLNVGSKSIL